MIALIGANGNMGRRYAAVMKFLEIPFRCFDVNDWKNAASIKDIHSVIIASSTISHFENIMFFSMLKIPILCEKPITKSKKELDEILDESPNLRMVNQYEYLRNGFLNYSDYYKSHYDYWNSGKDGQEWDCINIIGLSKSPPKLDNDSPYWNCQINGNILNIQDMDFAYINMIKRWWRNPEPNLDYIKEAHKRVHEGFYVKSSDRDSGANK